MVNLHTLFKFWALYFEIAPLGFFVRLNMKKKIKKNKRCSVDHWGVAYYVVHGLTPENALRGAYGHLVQNSTILRTFWVKYPLLLTEDGGRRVEDEKLRFEDGKWGFRIKNWCCWVLDWGWTTNIWGFHHATPKFNTHVSIWPLSRITLFWGHCNILNFPLKDDL